ncbi:Phosphoacetylglucosamine mutase [Zancudomyces culisetae]|uniref:Phosphoacetylglucosamine mutase n=1 Tax=Zancudomyces culisetae TaxID=1213189 RepID=A0A1R1PEY1_ZANCU|nr:Phosphoacetylglucosamine mutase [Zancudomyces culisetae]OMH81233.1 Phosphoacetylglucosamine mutase [Zancudomyces culisetae]|eukprot:OMH79473.1 Phosphoacetylglucosamine mutase [Zancudomyces culisetae]
MLMLHRGAQMESVVFRMGILASLRSMKEFGKAIGVMLTASHNKEEDNGLKLIDPMGEMLKMSWEGYCTQVANAESTEDLVAVLKNIVKEEGINTNIKAKIVYGCDTRPTAKMLVAALERGLEAMDAGTTNYGVVTTPQLHYFVCCINTENTERAYGEPTVDGYNKKLAKSFQKLVEHCRPKRALHVDCANGVGAIQVEKLAHAIGKDYLDVVIHNAEVSVENRLNVKCGADHVKTTQSAPLGVPMVPGERYCSFDGDADRLVYYFLDEGKQFHLLDGDRIASLVAMYIRDLLETAELRKFNLGVVQTAYANGSSTRYIRESLGLPVVMANTGVKYLHHEAEKFDIGVYFEANGHGTILFNPKTRDMLHAFEPQSPAQQEAVEKLLALRDVINETIGDAMSDMLVVEAILATKDWCLDDWNQTYTGLPNKLMKVTVKDRSIFRTTNAEQTLVQPEGLQDMIDQKVERYINGRSFVRPSGTEDAVRVYAEASTSDKVDELALGVAQLVYDYADGVGPRP